MCKNVEYVILSLLLMFFSYFLIFFPKDLIEVKVEAEVEAVSLSFFDWFLSLSLKILCFFVDFSEEIFKSSFRFPLIHDFLIIISLSSNKGFDKRNNWFGNTFASVKDKFDSVSLIIGYIIPLNIDDNITYLKKSRNISNYAKKNFMNEIKDLFNKKNKSHTYTIYGRCSTMQWHPNYAIQTKD